MLLTKCVHFRAFDILIRLRPGRPAPAQLIFFHLMSVQRVKRRLPVQAFALFINKVTEGRHRLVVTFGKAFPRHTQGRHFQLGDRGVVHLLDVARGLQLLLSRRQFPPRLRLFAQSEVFHRVNVDIDNVHPATRRRAVRARALRVSRIKRMNRVEADKRAAALRHFRQHRLQIAEVADAPVLFRTQGVELHAGAPQLFRLLQRLWFIAAFRRNNHPAVPALIVLSQR